MGQTSKRYDIFLVRPAFVANHLTYLFSILCPIVQVDFQISAFTDSYLASRNAPQALTAKSMEYWDDYSDIADQLNWTKYRQNYHAGMFFDPSWFAWSQDGSVLYVDLERNSAVLRIDVALGTAVAVDGTGLKSFASDGVDLVQDGGCPLFVTNPDLYALRGNKGLQAVNVDGVDYLFTADKGDDAGLDQYTEVINGQDLFNGTTLGPKGFQAASSGLFGSSSSSSSPFNKDCSKLTEQFCSPEAQFSLGSAGIDYSNPATPVLNKIVIMGGRGISLFKMPPTNEEQMSLVWDSVSSGEMQKASY